MRQESERIFSDALRLPQDVRARLAGHLLESLEEDPEDDPEEVEQAWAEEIGRRVAALDSGQAHLVSWAEVKERISRKRT